MSWQFVNIDSIKSGKPYSLVGGPFGSNLTTRDYVDEGVPVIRGTNLPDSLTFFDEGFVFVREEKADALFSNLAYPGDLVFTQRGTLGQVGLIPKEAKFKRYVISQSQMKLTVDETRADPWFIYYYFRHPGTVQTIKNHALTSGVPHINLGILKSFQMPLPPLETQNSLVEVLSAYDDLIENNRRRIQLLEESARLLYKEWFVHLRFPGHEHVKMVDGVPEGWKKLSIKDCCQKISYGYTASSSEEMIGPKFLRITDIVPASINWETVPYCIADEKNVQKYKLHEGDIVVARTGATVGYAKRISKHDGDVIYASYLVRFIPDAAIVDDVILSIFMESDEYKGFVKANAGGAAQPNANAQVLGSAKLLIPPKSHQESFREVVYDSLNQKQVLEKQISALAKARDLLLPKLMSGELTV
jgi:type I restriction enzyme S subunit